MILNLTLKQLATELTSSYIFYYIILVELLLFIFRLVDNLELNCFTFNDFGKEFVKSQKYSPDSFIQIAMQYAFYRYIRYLKLLNK